MSYLPGKLLPRPVLSRLTPSVHMPKFVAASAPTVCIVGDSTSAAPPVVGPIVALPGVSPIDNLSSMIKQRLMQDNPAKSITFKNFAIGSQTWSTLDTVASSNWPAFYFDTTLPWLPYVQAAMPTTLFINLGVNDANGMLGTSIRSVLAKIVAWGVAPATWTSGAKAAGTVIADANGKLQVVSTAGTSGGSAPTWATTVGAATTDGSVVWKLLSATTYTPSVPDLVLITNKNANIAAAAPYNTVLNQTGTLNAAAYQRCMALSGCPGFRITGLPPMGLIDIGRYFTMAYNGFDPAEQYLASSGLSGVSVTSFPYTLPSTAGDFDLNFTVPTGSGFNSGSAYIALSTGTPGSSAGSTITFANNGTTAYYLIGDASGQTALGVAVAGLWSAGSNTIEVVARGERLYVVVNGTVMSDTLNARFSGPFSPTITLTNPPASPAITINYFNTGTCRPYQACLSATDTFGSSGGPSGGNGINHNSSIGENAIDWAVLEATRFA